MRGEFRVDFILLGSIQREAGKALANEFLLPLGGHAITAAAPAIAAGFPAATNPASLLHAVKHGVEGREGESQRAFGLLLDAPRQLIAVKRPLFQNAENGQFRSASFDSRSNRSALPYI